MTVWRNQSGERSWWKLRSSTVETSTLPEEGGAAIPSPPTRESGPAISRYR